MSNHTSTPWVYDKDRPALVYSDDITGSLVGRFDGEGFEYVFRPPQECIENAKMAVRAVNTHARLVEIAESVAHHGVDFGHGIYEIQPEDIEKAREVLVELREGEE